MERYHYQQLLNHLNSVQYGYKPAQNKNKLDVVYDLAFNNKRLRLSTLLGLIRIISIISK